MTELWGQLSAFHQYMATGKTSLKNTKKEINLSTPKNAA